MEEEGLWWWARGGRGSALGGSRGWLFGCGGFGGLWMRLRAALCVDSHEMLGSGVS